MRPRLLAVSILVVLLAAGCGDKKKDKNASSAGTSTSAASTSKGSDPKLDSLVLVATDFPSGWTSTPGDSSTSAEDRAAEDEIGKCVGVSGSEAELARKSGDDFSQGENNQAGSEANVVKDEATYRSDINGLKNSGKVTSCMKEAFTTELKKQMPGLASVDIADLSVPKHGDLTIGRRLTVTGSEQGQTIKVYVDAVLMGKNRYELTQTFFGIGAPFDAALERTLVNKVGARLDAV